MFNDKKNIDYLRNDDNNWYTDYDGWDDEYDEPFVDEELSDAIFSALQELVDEEDNSYDELNEEFTSDYSANVHFNKHCVGGKFYHPLSKNLFYNFKTVEEYKEYEEELSNLFIEARNNEQSFIINLNETNISNKIDQLINNNNKILVFGLDCRFTNKYGDVRLCFRSISEDSVDFLIQTPNDRTATLYMISKKRIKGKINSKINSTNITNATNYSLF